MRYTDPQELARSSPASPAGDELAAVEAGLEAVAGDAVMPVEVAEWLGASLSVLVAAIHHPEVLAAQQPEADPVSVARAAVRVLPSLHRVAEAAAEQCIDGSAWMSGLVRRRGTDIVVSPGTEVSNLGLVLEAFAGAVLDPQGAEARFARGALGYSASAWAREIGVASGALPAPEDDVELPGRSRPASDLGAKCRTRGRAG